MGFGQLRWIRESSRITDGRLVMNYEELNSLDPGRQRIASRWQWLAWANYCHFYIEGLRKFSNRPSYIQLAARLERLLFGVTNSTRSIDWSDTFFSSDLTFLRGACDASLIDELRRYSYEQGPFLNVYDATQEISSIVDSDKTVFYVMTHKILQFPRIIEVLCNEALMERCFKILGRRAAVSWMWLWFTKSGGSLAENQKWHRDSSEPFNFVRAFIPLTAVSGPSDGPTEIIPGTSRVEHCFRSSRYSDDDVAGLIEEFGTQQVLCNVGDIYLANTFALHRGHKIDKTSQTRGMFSLLISLHPSFRTPGMPKIPIHLLSPPQREIALRNKSWLRHCVDFRTNPI